MYLETMASPVMSIVSMMNAIQVMLAVLKDNASVVLLMSTHASVLVDSVGPPSAEVCRAAASFP
jgi:hypothetical protein